METSFVQDKIFSEATLSPAADAIISNLFGLYSFLNSVGCYNAIIGYSYNLISNIRLEQLDSGVYILNQKNPPYFVFFSFSQKSWIRMWTLLILIDKKKYFVSQK